MEVCNRCKNEMYVAARYDDGFGKLWFCMGCALHTYEFEPCNHHFVVAKWRFESGVIHVMEKCIKCEEYLKSHKKKEVDYDRLPFSDELPSHRVYSDKIDKGYAFFGTKVEELKIEQKKETNAWTIQQWYYGYIESEMWRRKRKFIFKRANGMCERCDDKAVMVHHKTYARVGYEAPDDLMAVCLSCHGKEHGENPGLNIVNQFKIHTI